MKRANIRKRCVVDRGAQRFSWLLKQRGYKYWDENQLEQRIEVRRTRPDFFVETTAGNILVEVESLNDPGPLEHRQSEIGAIKADDFLDRLKRPVKHAAKQLSPYCDLSIPFLVVLDNWRRIRIPMRFYELVQIWGTFEYRGDFDPQSGTIGPMRRCHGGGQRLKEGQHEYISAIAVNMSKEGCHNEDVGLERPMCLRMIYNPFASYQMPQTIFQDKDDEHYYYKDSAWLKL